MKKISYLIVISLLSCFNAGNLIAQDEALDKVEETNFNTKNDSYVNFIDSYVSHINISSKDSDSFSEEELKSINISKGFKHNSNQKQVIYRNNEIVKVQYKEYLEHNFIKLKSFYYNQNHLICIKINELLPSKTNKVKKYQRTLYYHNNKLLLDSNQKDKKYNDKNLLNLGLEKLQKEYQTKVDD